MFAAFTSLRTKLAPVARTQLTAISAASSPAAAMMPSTHSVFSALTGFRLPSVFGYLNKKPTSWFLHLQEETHQDLLGQQQQATKKKHPWNGWILWDEIASDLLGTMRMHLQGKAWSVQEPQIRLAFSVVCIRKSLRAFGLLRGVVDGKTDDSLNSQPPFRARIAAAFGTGQKNTALQRRRIIGLVYHKDPIQETVTKDRWRDTDGQTNRQRECHSLRSNCLHDSFSGTLF